MQSGFIGSVCIYCRIIRYPTPICVWIYRGVEGSCSIFLRSVAIKTRSDGVSDARALPHTSLRYSCGSVPCRYSVPEHRAACIRWGSDGSPAHPNMHIRLHNQWSGCHCDRSPRSAARPEIGPAPAQSHPQTSQQLIDAEWLGEIIIWHRHPASILS